MSPYIKYVCQSYNKEMGSPITCKIFCWQFVRFSKQFLVAEYLFLFIFIEARSQDCGFDR